MIDTELLIECPREDYTCPYWDWKYQQCTMAAQGKGDPHEECEAFYELKNI